MALTAPTAPDSLARQEPVWRTLRRRMVTIPAFLAAAVLYTLALPFLLAIGLIVDVLGRRRFASVRAFAMVEVYLFCEAAGIVASTWIWLRRRDRESFLAANFRLQCWWVSTLYRSGVRLFSLRVTVEGAHAVADSPLLVFSRHVSVIDNLLPAMFISVPHKTHLRWVINRSLLRDPCLDIVGHRLPNCFVANSSGDSEAEVRRVGQLAQGLGSGDGVLIFPEGGLYSARRRERVLQRLAGGGDAELLERAHRLRNVLPPRLGGSLALLEAAQGVDAVFLAHAGMEDSTSYRAILGGGLIGREIRIRFWRVPASEIPSTPQARADWLFAQWQSLDDWVEAQHSNGEPNAR